MAKDNAKKTAQLDALADAMREVDPTRLAEQTRETQINIRLSEWERDSIRLAAQSCGLTVTDYLLRLHHLAAHRLLAPADS